MVGAAVIVDEQVAGHTGRKRLEQRVAHGHKGAVVQPCTTLQAFFVYQGFDLCSHLGAQPCQCCHDVSTEAGEVGILLVDGQPGDEGPLVCLLPGELNHQSGFPIARRRTDQRQLLPREQLEPLEKRRPAHIPDRQRRLRQLCPNDGF